MINPLNDEAQKNLHSFYSCSDSKKDSTAYDRQLSSSPRFDLNSLAILTKYSFKDQALISDSERFATFIGPHLQEIKIYVGENFMKVKFDNVDSCFLFWSFLSEFIELLNGLPKIRTEDFISGIADSLAATDFVSFKENFRDLSSLEYKTLYFLKYLEKYGRDIIVNPTNRLLIWHSIHKKFKSKEFINFFLRNATTLSP